jgi:sphingomyelin phosphodiesterase
LKATTSQRLSRYPGDRQVEKNADLLIGQLYGHTHNFEVEVMHDQETGLDPIAVSYVSGALTTGGSGNPGFGVFKYNRTTMEILDVEYHWASLDKAYEASATPVWELQGSAKALYGLGDVSPRSWQAVGEALARDDRVLNEYMTVSYKGAPKKHYRAKTDGPRIACDVLSGTPQERERCAAASLGGAVYMRKDLDHLYSWINSMMGTVIEKKEAGMLAGL